MTVNAVAGTPLGKLLSGLYLNLFLPSASSPVGVASAYSLNADYPSARVASDLIADGIEGLAAQYGTRARELVTSSPAVTLQVNSGILLGFLANETDPVVQALGHWIMVAYGNVYIDGHGGGDGRIPLVVVRRDGSVFLSDCGTTIIFGDVNTSNAPFIRFLQALCNGLTTLPNPGERNDPSSDPGQILMWHLALCGQMPALGTNLYKVTVCLPTMVRVYVRNKALITQPDGETSGCTLRRAAANAVLGAGVGRSSVESMILLGATQISPLLEAFYTTAKTRSPIFQKIRNSIQRADDPVAAYEALSSDGASTPAKPKKGSKSDKTSTDPDEASNAYRSDDNDESLADTVVSSSSKTPVVNDNAMNSSYSGTDDTIDLLPLTAGDESGNAFYYRRAILALRTALDKDPDANVSAEARKTLNLLCRDWLFLVSLDKVKETITALGMDKLLQPVKAFA